MIGYIFKSPQGAFAPEGKVELTDVEIAAHNKRCEELELVSMKQTGRASLYLTRNDSGNYQVGTWAGGFHIPVCRVSISRHNMAGKNGRTDVWFRYDSSLWHGLNIGDNDICRVKRTKTKFAVC